MKKSRKVVYLEKNQPRHGAVIKPGPYGELVGACRGILFQHLEAGLEPFFTQVDDDLFRLAENATSNQRQTLFFDALRSFRLLRKQIEANFLQGVENAYQLFWSGQPIPAVQQAEAAEERELSLVEKDDLEEELAVATMISRVKNACHRDLLALDMRFARMSERSELSHEGNPVGPDTLALAFREALGDWDADVLARIVAYKCFDREVMARMGDAYEAMNIHLAESGVLPELRYNTIHRRGAQSSPNGEVAGAAVADGVGETTAGEGPESTAGETASAAEVPPLEQIWQYIRQLQAAAASMGALPAADPSLPVIPRGELMKGLTRLQVQAPESLPQMDFAGQQRYLLAQLGGGDGERPQARLGEQEQQVIDVILMLFNQVLDDPNLPDALRALIGRLQIPVLKAAIADSGFLENQDHPARRLLNELAEASVGWRDDGDRSERSLYTQVKKAVDRIVHEFEDDIGLFEEVRAEFAAWKARRERARKILEARLAEAASGEERLVVAGQRVERLLEAWRVQELPEGAADILQGPWKKLLTILWLREGEEGANWQRGVELGARIAGYLRPGAPVDRQAFLDDIPEILAGLKKGFQYISLDRKRISQLLNRLQGCFIAALRPPSDRPAQAPETDEDRVDAPPQTSADRGAATDHAVEEAPEPDEHDRQAAELGEGTWIKIEQNDGGEEAEPLVCKLVWRSRYTGTMVFVDGQGNKAAQMKEEELAELFRVGRASLLEEVQAPLIDRALRKMLGMLTSEIKGLRRRKDD